MYRELVIQNVSILFVVIVNHSYSNMIHVVFVCEKSYVSKMMQKCLENLKISDKIRSFSSKIVLNFVNSTEKVGCFFLDRFVCYRYQSAYVFVFFLFSASSHLVRTGMSFCLLFHGSLTRKGILGIITALTANIVASAPV